MIAVGERTVIFVDEGSLIIINVGRSWIVIVEYSIFINLSDKMLLTNKASYYNFVEYRTLRLVCKYQIPEIW